ncbi:alanine acetyltransferase [Pseudoxanthomonas sp. UTMC 1351]|uniref:alanine acetyltransferase n=1 Tax=Pseudoxanthomonas sp. UTMC 1351 TaxID=2695853 RepID=UPI0034CEF41E
MLWSAEQQEWLSALGHTLYVPGPLPVESLEASVPLAKPQTTAAGPAASVPARRAPPAPAAGPTANTSTPPRRAAGALPDRLHFALIRASGCNPNAAGAAEIIAQWPSSAELRGNPAAKRALWPALRKLRRPNP